MEENPGLPISVSSGEEKFAKFISVIFHPLLMPTYGFILIFCTKNYISTFVVLRSKIVIIGITFLFTFVFPAINAIVLLKMGRIRSLEMESTKERIIPYATTALYYFALLYLFYHVNFLFIFKMVLLGATSIILLTLLINTKWKISAHTAGIGGVAGAILGMLYRLQIDLELIFFVIILIAGLVGYARLRLNAHTPAQVYSGFLLGFLVQLMLIMLY
jgi:membrane-associated phospholipid phosphatase